MLYYIFSILSLSIDYFVLTRISHVDKVTAFKIIVIQVVLGLVMLVLTSILKHFYDNLFVISVICLPTILLSSVMSGFRIFVFLHLVLHRPWHYIVFCIVISTVNNVTKYGSQFKRLYDGNVQIIKEQNSRRSYGSSRLL